MDANDPAITTEDVERYLKARQWERDEEGWTDSRRVVTMAHWSRALQIQIARDLKEAAGTFTKALGETVASGGSQTGGAR